MVAGLRIWPPNIHNLPTPLYDVKYTLGFLYLNLDERSKPKKMKVDETQSDRVTQNDKVENSKANATLVNTWKDREHPNVLILQVIR